MVASHINPLQIRIGMIMLLNLLLVFLSLKGGKCGDGNCEASNTDQLYVTCKGNFTKVEALKVSLENISQPIAIFQLQDATLDVLPPDAFEDVLQPRVRKVIFDNVSLELLEVPELGNSPFKSIRDTVDTLEIYYSPKVFAWDFPSLRFQKLQTIIIEDSELISITIPFFFWPKLHFIQIQNCAVKWIHYKAFQGNQNMVIFSLAHNEISHITRNIFPKPADKLYSLDLSSNRLEAFPEDMFSEMNSLQELKIDNNRLKTLNQNILKQVWNNLKMLWLDGNQALCESVCWMIEQTDKPLFLKSSNCKVTNKFVLLNEYFKDCPLQISSKQF